MRIPELRENLQGRPKIVERRVLDSGADAYIVSNFVTKEELEELQTDLADAIEEQNNLLLEILKQVSIQTLHQAAMSKEDIGEDDIEINN